MVETIQTSEETAKTEVRVETATAKTEVAAQHRHDGDWRQEVDDGDWHQNRDSGGHQEGYKERDNYDTGAEDQKITCFFLYSSKALAIKSFKYL